MTGEQTAVGIAASVASGRISAAAVIESALARIEAANARLGAFTDVTAQRARDSAAAIDTKTTRVSIPP